MNYPNTTKKCDAKIKEAIATPINTGSCFTNIHLIVHYLISILLRVYIE